jgi:hypothetical protein
MRILWGMVIHFVAYRVHVEGTNLEIINISDFKFIKPYNKYNEVPRHTGCGSLFYIV